MEKAVAMSREQGAGSREQGAGKQGVDNIANCSLLIFKEI
jgi:hypothetical protein